MTSQLAMLAMSGVTASLRSTRRLALLVCAAAMVMGACAERPTQSPDGVNQSNGEGIPVSTPAAEGINESALKTLIDHATAEKSDAIVILRNGKLVYENYFGTANEPIPAMSASKSFVGLAFGYLLADHKLTSLDERVSTVLPTFANVDARKAAITYRQLLSHSSGLDPKRAGGTVGDIEATAIASRTLFPPGAGWQYNNQGVDFLAALAGRLGGIPMDQYLRDKLFTPLGITRVTWYRDPRGVPLGAGEMSIRPYDLAKVGQVILDGGVWQGKTVLPPGWMTTSTAASTTFAPDYGLLWWRLVDYTSFGITSDLLAQWQFMGASESTITKLQPITSTAFQTGSATWQAILGRVTPAEATTLAQWLSSGDHMPWYRVTGTSPSYGFAAEGWLGQYLVIVPDKKLVAVRMRRATAADYASTTEVNGYWSFPSDVFRLVR